MDFTLATIAAMCHQEQSYTVQQTILQISQHYSCYDSSQSQLKKEIDEDCRTQMAAWCFQVVDYCQFSRETVEIAMNYLDRFIATSAGRAAFMDRSLYQLAAMTCLYTAVKIHEPKAMDPQLVSNLSRGVYSAAQIEAMEVTILTALQWRVNPPTALAFVRQFLELIPTSVLDEKLRQAVYNLTKFQTELAVNENDCVTCPASTVAFCSLMNSLESLVASTHTSTSIDADTLEQIYMGLSLSVGISATNDNDSVLQIQNFLYEAVLRQPAATTLVLQPPSAHCRHFTPRTSSSVKQTQSCLETSPRSSIVNLH